MDYRKGLEEVLHEETGQVDEVAEGKWRVNVAFPETEGVYVEVAGEKDFLTLVSYEDRTLRYAIGYKWREGTMSRRKATVHTLRSLAGILREHLGAIERAADWFEREEG